MAEFYAHIHNFPPCAYCHKTFTHPEILTGDPIRNEKKEIMHTACYNQWCSENPHPVGDVYEAQSRKAVGRMNDLINRMIWGG